MSIKRSLRSYILDGIKILIGLAVIFPILYAISLSFMTGGEILTRDLKILPDSIQWNNYKLALQIADISRYMWNSFVISFTASIVRMIVASFTAFAYAFFEFKGKKILFMLSLLTLMIPGDVVVISNYTTISSLGLTNTYLGMMSVYLVYVLNIFILRQSFMTVSKEIFEAAKIDGCGNFRILTQILLPISKPVLATIFISSFIQIWNSYIWPMLVTTDPKYHTVQVGVTLLRSADGGTIYGPIMAAATMVLLPSVLVFVVFQKQIISGIAAGSVKG